jgi:large subunit ribosomal protein L15e
MWKSNTDELKSKSISWRREPVLNRIARPSRLGRGGMRKQRPVSGRRPKHFGVVHIKQGVSMRKVAEHRVNEKYPNLEVMGSYYLHKDGKYLWYEVILADPAHPRIYKDKELRAKLKAFAKY